MSPIAFRLSIAAMMVVAVLGSFLDVMEVDAAQYAAMSREMLGSDDWLSLHHRGRDYLDKPPLLFWLSALSYKLFGVHNWSYKLPSILFAFLGLYATYRFTRLHHEREVARTAAFMFGASAAFLLMTNDVRCDTMLTGSVITAIWLGMAWLEQRRTWQLLGAALAVGAGMLAKGPMGAMAPLLAIGGHIIITRNWNALRDVRLVAVPFVIGLALLPMCIGLYEQHGTHGLRFYFWEQSFGRITGENRWKDDSSVFFFTHEVIWLVLPWTVFVLHGLGSSVMALARGRKLPEYAALCGAVLVFVALSLSQFKLPHYLFVIAPLFAVLGARSFHALPVGVWHRIHGAILLVLLLTALVLSGWSFPMGRWPFLALLLWAGMAALLLLRMGQGHGAWLPASAVVWFAIAVAINGHVYPQLLGYQGNAVAGRAAAAAGAGPGRFFGLQCSGTALDHYAGFAVPWLSNAAEAATVVGPGVMIWTDGEQINNLRSAGLEPRSIVEVPDHPVQLLGLDFLDPERRSGLLRDRYLLTY